MILRATLRRTGSCLLGHVDDAHAALADLLEQLVRADDGTRSIKGGAIGREHALGSRFAEAAGFLVGEQEFPDAAPQHLVGAARLVQIDGPLVRRQFEGREENLLHAAWVCAHRSPHQSSRSLLRSSLHRSPGRSGRFLGPCTPRRTATGAAGAESTGAESGVGPNIKGSDP